MNIIERGQVFLQGLRELAARRAWDWRQCPHCGTGWTCCWGSYTRHPWFLTGRRRVRVQRHRCAACGRTYSEQSALLVRGSWYAREVRRCALDHWQHVGTSVRRTAELLRSWLGQQERWQLWRPLDPAPAAATRSTLSARLSWVLHQRCVFHRWRKLGGELAARTAEAGRGLTKSAAAAVQRHVRRELVALVRAVLDAASEAAAQGALGPLRGHRLGGGLAAALAPHLAAAHVCHRPYTRQLGRVSPEW